MVWTRQLQERQSKQIMRREEASWMPIRSTYPSQDVWCSSASWEKHLSQIFRISREASRSMLRVTQSEKICMQPSRNPISEISGVLRDTHSAQRQEKSPSMRRRWLCFPSLYRFFQRNFMDWPTRTCATVRDISIWSWIRRARKYL